MADARRLGAILLALLVLLGLPGIVLALTYATDPADAHEAVAAKDAAPPSRLARGVHAWAATGALGLALLHAARSYAAGRMRAPGRRPTLAALAALAVLTGAYFTGTILPWDQQGWEAYEHLRMGAGAVGIDTGGATPESAPLRALFLLHVLAVPVALGALLLLHFHRGAPAVDLRRVAGLLRSSWIPIAALAGALLALAFLAPPELGPAPITGLRVTRPDWPFLWLVPLQDAMGAQALLALPLAFLIAAGALFLPAGKNATRRIVVLSILSIGWLGLTLLGAR